MKKFLFSFFLLLTAVVSRAHDFEVDGIYYDITSAEEHTVAVTFRGQWPDAFEDRYSGSVVIPESVIYNGATYNVTEINFRAFYYCRALTSIAIPNCVAKIGERALSYCFALEQIVVADDNPVYDSRDNCNAIIETSSNRLISGCKNTVIPNDVTEIGKYAFMGCKGLTSITIPNSVTEICERTFDDCDSLTSIVIPNNVTKVGNYAFRDCWALEHIVVADDNPVYDSRDNCNAIVETSSNKLISGCKNTVIPNSVTTIGTGAFAICGGLTSITIPNSVTAIDYEAFLNCYTLTSIAIPNSVTTIGDYAFEACTALTSVSIGNGVTKISMGAFHDCSTLKNFYCFTKNVPTTDTDAFYGVKLSSAVLHVPAASLEAYAATSPWSKFGQIVAIGEGDGIEQLTAEEEGNSAFKNPTVYDLSGRRVSKSRKGIYVIGGRKTVVK